MSAQIHFARTHLHHFQRRAFSDRLRKSKKKTELLTRYKLVIEVSGTNFDFYQATSLRLTTEEVLECALENFSQNRNVKIESSTGIDHGSHALRQVVHVDLKRVWETGYRVPTWDPEWVRSAVNYKLKELKEFHGPEIRVVDVTKIPPTWDVRLNLKQATYVYRCSEDLLPGEGSRMELTDSRHFPLLDKKIWRIPLPEPLDTDQMHEAADILSGTHNYASLLRPTPIDPSLDTRRECYIEVREGPPETIPFPEEFYSLGERPNGRRFDVIIKGTRFLPRQLRTMVALIIRCGAGDMCPEELRTIFETVREPTEELNSMIAPRKGLFLAEVEFRDLPEEFDWKKEKLKLKPKSIPKASIHQALAELEDVPNPHNVAIPKAFTEEVFFEFMRDEEKK